MKSCFHSEKEDMAIRIPMGYVTLPSYALVTQMGSTMKPTIFNKRVARALRNWHLTAKKQVKQNRGLHSHNSLPCRPTAQAQILRHCHSEMETYPSSSIRSNFEAQYHYEIDSTSFSDSVAASNSIQHHEMKTTYMAHDQQQKVAEPNPLRVYVSLNSQHEIHVEHNKELTLDKR
ncbi:hypothetical protein Fmac_019635 [Flemingia macrophylla]|uniref:Uncharacterized protein n=1 Tax=Flemingia macrophylla TaxID=520843 RepID=A0ABD1M8F0_9FABA